MDAFTATAVEYDKVQGGYGKPLNSVNSSLMFYQANIKARGMHNISFLFLLITTFRSPICCILTGYPSTLPRNLQTSTTSCICCCLFYLPKLKSTTRSFILVHPWNPRHSRLKRPRPSTLLQTRLLLQKREDFLITLHRRRHRFRRLPRLNSTTRNHDPCEATRENNQAQRVPPKFSRLLPHHYSTVKVILKNPRLFLLL